MDRRWGIATRIACVMLRALLVAWFSIVTVKFSLIRKNVKNGLKSIFISKHKPYQSR